MVDVDTTNNLHRHPIRWGQLTCFGKHHDIYTLVSFVTCSSKEILGHADVVICAQTVSNCIINRKWEDLEDWESQKFVREAVLEPLRSG